MFIWWRSNKKWDNVCCAYVVHIAQTNGSSKWRHFCSFALHQTCWNALSKYISNTYETITMNISIYLFWKMCIGILYHNLYQFCNISINARTVSIRIIFYKWIDIPVKNFSILYEINYIFHVKIRYSIHGLLFFVYIQLLICPFVISRNIDDSILIVIDKNSSFYTISTFYNNILIFLFRQL